MSENRVSIGGFWKKSLFFLVFLFVFFGTRAPYYFSPFDGEDGNGLDADIFLRPTEQPNYFRIARVNGKDFYTIPQHPGFLFESMKAYGGLVRTIHSPDESNFPRLVAELKFWFSLPQLIFYLVLLLWIFTLPMTIVNTVGLGLVAIASKLSILSSNELQPDTFVGLLSCGMFGIFLAMREMRVFSRVLDHCAVLLLSLLIGLGKSEWTVCFVSGWIGAFALLAYGARANLKACKPYFVTFLLGLGGVSIGNLLSYFISPDNYFASWGLLGRMISTHSMAGGQFSLKRVFNLGKDRFPFIGPVVITLLVSCFQLKPWVQNKQFGRLALFMLTLSFFTAFYSSTWFDLHRYFAPAFALSLPLLALILTAREFGPKTQYLIYGLFAWTAIQAGSNTFAMYRNHDWSWERPPFPVHAENCVPLVDVSEVFGRGRLDYIHGSVGYDDADVLFTAQYGKHPCKSR